MFSRIDLGSGYYQIRIVEVDEEKIACCIRYGSYKFLVMFFGFSNTLATFCTFMNNIFREWFNDFVIIYIDDNLVSNNFMEEHVKHFQKVFPKVEKKQVV